MNPSFKFGGKDYGSPSLQMIIDFKEIGAGRTKQGAGEDFELFSRDLLEKLGYRVVSKPGRGGDGGRDFVVEERIGDEVFRWLVSCKHFAHSDASVGVEHETNVRDRLEHHDCQGFLGVYSTLPSSALVTRVESLKDTRSLFFDRGKIEEALLRKARDVAARYTPVSYRRWLREHPQPISMLSGRAGLPCVNCGTPLLPDPRKRGLAMVRFRTRALEAGEECPYDAWPFTELLSVDWCCKNDCDRRTSQLSRRVCEDFEELGDFCNPIHHLLWVDRFMWGCQQGAITAEAYEAFRLVIGESFHYVAREPTLEEIRCADDAVKLEIAPDKDGPLQSTIDSFLEAFVELDEAEHGP